MTEALALVARIEADLAALRALLDAPREPEAHRQSPQNAAIESKLGEWLEPCLLADRLRLSEGYVRKLIKRGIGQELPGFAKRGGRLYAATDAVKELWGG